MCKLSTTILVVFFTTTIFDIKPSQLTKMQCEGQCLMQIKQEEADKEINYMRKIMDSKEYNPINAIVLELYYD
ncbi:hypothetical protein ACQP6C_04615 [Snodgrassella alvi]|uniref:hypothetical protein n=1 Tax=Snodgrassella alvi TaxID=1196083 RepID=UPI003D07C2BC